MAQLSPATAECPGGGTALVWFRRDLRLDDSPALRDALACSARVVPLYIHAPSQEAPWAPGAASRWWLNGSLASLDRSLRDLGSRLVIARGDSLDELRRMARATSANRVFWNRLYDPSTRERDTRIKQALRADGLRCDSSNGGLLFEPWEIRSRTGEPYRVFSAFWRACLEKLPEVAADPAPSTMPAVPPDLDSLCVDSLGLMPRVRWYEGFAERWAPGEPAALARAAGFLDLDAAGYSERRDIPALAGTSRLSPHLHFGEISPRRLIAMAAERFRDLARGPAETFIREVGWREFAHHLIHHFPHTVDHPLDPRYERFPWRDGPRDVLLADWQQGRTGIPLVDAGMRELWHTGWMHNRVRMIVASFLTKNLRLPWQLGARWFWDTLVDADLANNTLGWQWAAGCGADAAPYFRVFNPVRQGERFDPDGAYVRRWCPELTGLPSRYIHEPWGAPAQTLEAAGVTLGRDYPRPIVDLGQSRKEALEAYQALKRA